MLSRRFSNNCFTSLITTVEQLTTRMAVQRLRPNAREGSLPIAIKPTIVPLMNSFAPRAVSGFIGEAMLGIGNG